MNRKILFFCLLTALPFVLDAQALDTKWFKGVKPRNIGPAGMSGRVTAIDVDLSNPDIIYAGTASGGVWKSTSGGVKWEPIFDDQPVQSIGAIAINQNNPSDIWVGTGEGNPRNSQNTGAGIYRSLDGGKTWKYMGLKETQTIHRIVVSRDNPDVVFAGAQGAPFGPNPERGIYRTKDGGKTWDKILYTNDRAGCADLVADPSNPKKLVAALWEYGRQPWFFTSGGTGSGIYVTHDGGDSWVKRTEKDGLPAGNLGRTGLAIARSKPNVAYALVEAKENGLYRSNDGGATWAQVSKGDEVSNRPFYYHEIYVDPKNENRVYNLYSMVSKSEDGGKTFQILLPYSGVHPDHHAWWIHPDNPNFMIDGNDGGLNITRDGGVNWVFADNIPVGQFYHVNFDMDIPYNVAGGLQDNGSFVGPSNVWQQGGIQNSHWQEVYFGDGFDVSFRPDNNRYVYAMSQGGNLGLVDRETGKTTFIRPTHPDKVELRFNWNAAFAQDPHNACGIYYGSQFLHYSKDCGQSWEILSPDLTTNDTSRQRKDTGGLTYDVTSAENNTTILAIGPSPVDSKVIWVGTDDGNLQLTRDGGKTWTNLLSKLTGVKPGSWVPFIAVSEKNAGEALVVVNDYRRNDHRPMVFHTTDYGQTFTRIADETKVQGYALSIAQDPEAPGHLWLGTDNGLFFSIDGGKNWNKWMNGYPSVPTSDLKIHPRDQDLVIGTFGRALWIFDDIRPFREMARTEGKVLEQPLKVFPAPDAYLAEYKSFLGYHFPAMGRFEGETKSADAIVTVWNKPDTYMVPAVKPAAVAPTMEKGKKAAPVAPAAAPESKPAAPAKRPERAKVIVLGEKGDTVRVFSTKLDTGLTRITWGLERNGFVGLGGGGRQQERRPDADVPPGPSVLPGKYKLIVQYGEHKDSTFVTVKADPRLNVSMADLQAREAVYAEMEKISKSAAAGTERLRDAANTIKRVDAALGAAPEADKQAIAKLGKAMQDSITQIEKTIFGEGGSKVAPYLGETLQRSIGAAQQYLRALDGPANQAVTRTLERARAHTAQVLDKINAFMEKDFAAYKAKVEALQFSLFKAAEPLKMKN